MGMQTQSTPPSRMRVQGLLRLTCCLLAISAIAAFGADCPDPSLYCGDGTVWNAETDKCEVPTVTFPAAVEDCPAGTVTGTACSLYGMYPGTCNSYGECAVECVSDDDCPGETSCNYLTFSCLVPCTTNGDARCSTGYFCDVDFLMACQAQRPHGDPRGCQSDAACLAGSTCDVYDTMVCVS